MYLSVQGLFSNIRNSTEYSNIKSEYEYFNTKNTVVIYLNSSTNVFVSLNQNQCVQLMTYPRSKTYSFASKIE